MPAIAKARIAILATTGFEQSELEVPQKKLKEAGASVDVIPDLYFGSLKSGDIMLLASDGLTGMLEDELLAKILASEGDPQSWVDKMIVEANRRGGLDNITAIVVRIDAVDQHTGETPAITGATGAKT